jgi:hypothetical protein
MVRRKPLDKRSLTSSKSPIKATKSSRLGENIIHNILQYARIVLLEISVWSQ